MSTKDTEHEVGSDGGPVEVDAGAAKIVVKETKVANEGGQSQAVKLRLRMHGVSTTIRLSTEQAARFKQALGTVLQELR